MNNESPWKPRIDGKLVETYGMYNPTGDQATFRLVDGTWHLVRLEDQVARDVELRGLAYNSGGRWGFEYRGTKLYVENMGDLPGWSNNNHGRAISIKGRLERALLPSLEQNTMIKSDRDLCEQYIVRNPSWEPLPSLLVPERSLPELVKKPKHLGDQPQNPLNPAP